MTIAWRTATYRRAFPASDCTAVGASFSEISTETKLYFGTAMPNGREVSASEWEKFVKREIVPRFDGFSVAFVVGTWKGVVEATYLFSVVHMHMDTDRLIDEIARAYKLAFSQEAVMRTDAVVSVEFV